MCERCAVFPGSLSEAAIRHNIAIVCSNREPFKEWENVFEDYGLDVTMFPAGFNGTKSAFAANPRLVVLDDQTLRLPLVEELKKRNIGYAVVSKNSGNAETVLSSGADQFIGLPVHPRVALSYIRAVVARRQLSHKEIVGREPIKVGEAEVDFAGRTIKKCGREMGLSLNGWKLLEALSDRPGKVVPRVEMEHFIDGTYGGVRVAMSQIRKVFEDDTKNPKYFVTVLGIGFKFANGDSK